MSRPWFLLFVCFLLGHSAWMYSVSAIRNDAFPCWSLNKTFVDCSALYLEHVPPLPQTTTSLDFSDNRIHKLANNSFYGLDNLLQLKLCTNGITSMEEQAFANLQQLEELNLKENPLVYIHREVFIPLQSLRKLDLSTVRITAIPEALRMLHNLQDVNLASNRITSANLDIFRDLKNLPLLDYKPDCKSYLGYYTCIVMSTFLFLYTTMTYMMVKYHAYIRYLYQYARGKLRGYQAIPHRHRYEYDVFVSYNNEDIRWVQWELIPHLEEAEPHYRLCIGDRDFLAGRDITTNIVEAIQGSRKTLCLLTQRFVRSGWCTLEFKIAQHRLFEEGEDVLVLVLLEDIPAHVVQRYNRLRQLMSRKTYLVWPEDERARPLFWVRLRKALGVGNVLPYEEDV
ncbi:TLR2 [Branchiostoma lanceolatum]|uniref:TLR2 protein n=1 Tax=Branchiostoma lanceolatum TaxID=7740 RepID=A0A8K0A6A4_BRALA|nr:TLR2 [Branchiostoma lanceolatum]